MPKRPVTTATAVDGDRRAEFERHVERIDVLLESDTVSPSEVTGLLRERRMTLNAIEGLTVAEGPGEGVDEIRQRREQRRQSVAKQPVDTSKQKVGKDGGEQHQRRASS